MGSPDGGLGDWATGTSAMPFLLHPSAKLVEKAEPTEAFLCSDPTGRNSSLFHSALA